MNFFPALADFVLKRRIVVIIFGFLVALGLMAGAPNLNFDTDARVFFDKNKNVFMKLGRINKILISDIDKSFASLVVKGEIYKIYFNEDVDLNKVKDSLMIKRKKIISEMDKIKSRLSNKNFADKAPKEIVDQEKSNFNKLEKDANKIKLTLESL